MPYDRALIPPGHTEDDVKTFYFGRPAGRWIELPRASVDKDHKLINSTTDHFTDMITHGDRCPITADVSFNPTSMKDIKAADPGAQINLIEPPKVNNMGDARLSYPIEVPPGRQGLQPQLSINYNSSGGNGWLGVGWETLDAFDQHRHALRRAEVQRKRARGGPTSSTASRMVKVAEGEYRLRIEGPFQRIRRYGTAPNNYWWVVTDKNGMRQIFGGDASAQLRDPNGRGIFVWHLNRMVDANGKPWDYEYAPKNQPCTQRRAGGLHLSAEIRYTGSIPVSQSDDAVRGIPPFPGANFYRVTFFQDSAARLDAVVDAAARSRPCWTSA